MSNSSIVTFLHKKISDVKSWNVRNGSQEVIDLTSISIASHQVCTLPCDVIDSASDVSADDVATKNLIEC